ncbi:MAG TPA: FAD-dependent oxidoreductase [Gaiellales bacterium]|jgi:dihydrolipoamide dehydrogenase|nr:FAD-dependent oxidoreductase [Gaiellales bacterium]
MKLVILGGGPAGYAAAATAAHMGADVTLVEELSLGGNCTMTDAVPSKTLLTTADSMLEVARAESNGLDFVQGYPSVNLRRTLARARAVALHQSRGVRERMDGMNVKVLPGRGRLTSQTTLIANVDERDHELEFDALLVCTGASPFLPPFAHPDGGRVLTTRQVFELRDLPEHLVVLGAGPTGCEFADFFSRCGSRVTLVSARDQILPNDDPDLAEVLEEVFLRRGMDVIKNGRAAALDCEDDDVVRLVLEDGRDLTCSHLLLCIGMRPNTQGLGLEVAGVEFGDRGTLPVDDFCRTSVGHIYACGDVTGQVMLANTAALHGRTAALHALGIDIEPVSYTGVAWCVFTRPEIAKAGISERQARIDDVPVSVTKHLIRANPRAVMEGETDGMIKLLSDPDDGTILGGAMVGFRASEVITAVALAVHARLSVQVLAETAAVNPSMSESLQRAAEKAAEGMLGVSRVTLTS